MASEETEAITASVESKEVTEGKDEQEGDRSLECLKCKTKAAEYECDPCGCVCFCKRCAMKMASGGKCKRCNAWYGGVRLVRIQQVR
mmetsp:Transcript_67103/g.135256  ORF Transcript_67103/g.135256 Transcript_67103/m.135256 type:complete len:87 (-) Transcript_67103:374-634(-)